MSADDNQYRGVHDNNSGMLHKHEPVTGFQGEYPRAFEVSEDIAYSDPLRRMFHLCKHCGALYMPKEEL